MTGVDIQVAAHDHATKVLEAVREQLVQLQQDTGNFQAASAQVSVGQDSLAESLAGVANSAKAALAAFVGFLGVRGLIGFAGDSVDAFNTQSRALDGLENALMGASNRASELRQEQESLQQQMARTEAVRQATKDHAEFAAQLQKLTGVGDEVTLGIQRRAALLGVPGAQLDAIAAAAIGVSEATGLGLDQALRKVNDTINGNLKALGDYLPALRQTEDAEQQLALVTGLAEQGLKQKQESLSRLDGVQQRARNAMNGLKESVGELLAPFKAVALQGVAVFAETLNNNLAPSVQEARQAMKNLGEFMKWAGERGIAAATALKVVWNNFSDSAVLAFKIVELRWEMFVSEAKWAFESAHAAAIWWSQNFSTVMKSSLTEAGTLWQLFAGNAQATFDWMVNGFEGGLDGMMKKWLEVAKEVAKGHTIEGLTLPSEPIEREISRREKELLQRIGELGAGLGGEFQEQFDRAIEGFREKLVAQPNLDLSLNVNAATEKSLKANASALQAVESRLLLRGPQQDPLMSVVENTKRTADEVAKTREALQLRSRPGPPPSQIIVNEVSL